MMLRRAGIGRTGRPTLITTAAPQHEATAAPAEDPIVAQLAQLADLKQRGLLTDAEFDAQKARLLGGS